MVRALTFATMAAAVGCSLLVNRADSQCTVEGAPCPKYEGFVCVQGGCVRATDAAAASDTGVAETDPQPRADTAVTECETTQECIAGRGNNWICSHAEKRCVDLTSRDCPSVLGNSSSDKVVLFGALLPLLGPHKRRGLSMSNTLALALADFSSNGGVSLADGSKRPVAIVMCDESDDPVRAARHLSALKVPIVLGTAFSSSTRNVARAITIPDGTLLLSPAATTSLTSLNAQGLVQRTCATDAPEAAALRQAVALLETKLRQPPLSLTSVRVALVRKTDDNGNDLRALLVPQLRFNGNLATDAANQSYFIDTNYGNPDSVPPDVNYALAVSASTRAISLPDIVVVMGSTEAARNVVKGIEDSWTGSPSRRPYYLLSSALVTEELLDVADVNEDLRKRIVGTLPGADGARSQAFGAFTIRYRSRFSDGTLPIVSGAPQLFDAFYQAAFGVTASKQLEVTGANVAAALAKTSIPGAPAFVVGAAQIDPATAALLASDASGTIDLEGLSGSLDRDGAGEVATEVQFWCISKTGADKAVFEYSGRYMNAAGQVQGASSALCPPLQ